MRQATSSELARAGCVVLLVLEYLSRQYACVSIHFSNLYEDSMLTDVFLVRSRCLLPTPFLSPQRSRLTFYGSQMMTGEMLNLGSGCSPLPDRFWDGPKTKKEHALPLYSSIPFYLPRETEGHTHLARNCLYDYGRHSRWSWRDPARMTNLRACPSARSSAKLGTKIAFGTLVVKVQYEQHSSEKGKFTLVMLGACLVCIPPHAVRS